MQTGRTFILKAAINNQLKGRQRKKERDRVGVKIDQLRAAQVFG